MKSSVLLLLPFCLVLDYAAPVEGQLGRLKERTKKAVEAKEKATSAAEDVPTSLPTGAGHSAEQKQAAWKRMDELLTDYNQFASGYGMADKIGEYSERWARFTREWAEFAPEFFAAYGTTEDLIKQTLQGVEVPEGVIRHLHTLAADAAAVDVDDKQQQIADWAVSQGDERLVQLEKGREHAPDKTEVHLKRATQIAMLYSFAEELEPGKHTAKLEKANQLVAELDAANLATIATVKWPGHNQKYSGTDSPDELAAAALLFLKEHPNWTKPEYDDDHVPYIAAVQGSGWEVNKRAPLTGVPTQYSLNMYVGFKGKKKSDVLYVYQMVFYTEEAAGVTPSLPFRYANSRQYAKHQMLLANAPKP